jgi:hypothetical protein
MNDNWQANQEFLKIVSMEAKRLLVPKDPTPNLYSSGYADGLEVGFQKAVRELHHSGNQFWAEYLEIRKKELLK